MNKAKYIFIAIFSFINSLIAVFAMKFHYTILDMFAKKEEVYLDSFKLTDILLIALFFVLWVIILLLLEKIINKPRQEKKLWNISNKKLFFISVIVFLVLWSPYYLSFFPGGVYSDTYQQLRQAMYGITGGGHPVFYSLLLRFLYYISFKNTNVLFGIYTILQLCLFVISLSYFIVWLKKKNISKKWIIIWMIFFAINPRIPAYAISIWKDSLFAIFLFLYILKVYDIIESNGELLKNKKEIIIYIILGILTSLFRNNGYPIILLISIILFIKYRRNFKDYKIFYISTSASLAIIIGIYNILFPLLGYKIPYVESIGINIQQIAYVMAYEDYEKEIDKETLDTLNNIVPVEFMASQYTPMNVDMIKALYAFKNDYLESHKLEFWKAYFKIMVKYPKDYILAKLYNTVGWWNYYSLAYYSGSNSLKMYYEVMEFDDPPEGTIVDQVDIIKNIFGFSIKDILYEIVSYMNNCAIGSLFAFIGIYILIIKKKMNRIIMYIPSILTFLALALEAPVAFSSRYIIYTILFIPLSILIPFMENKKEANN